MKRASRGEYQGAGVSDSHKVHIAEIAIELQKVGLSIPKFAKLLDNTSFSPSERTIRNHVMKINKTGTPLSTEKHSGRRKCLTEEQLNIVCGAVLSQEVCVGLKFVIKDWIEANFGIDVSIATCCNYMDDHSITMQLFGSRSWPKGTTKEDFIFGYFDFVKRVRDNGVFTRDPCSVLCIDSCTNSVRIDRVRGLAMSGGRQQVFERDKPKYTNTYVTCVSLNATVEFKTIMFTHDPAFDTSGSSAADVLQWCKLMKISRDQIYFVKPENNNKSYNAECNLHYAQYKRIYLNYFKDATIFHDGGPAFKVNGEYVFEEGANEVIVFPSVQHGRLSVLDNYLFGIAKTTWRSERSNSNFSWDAVKLIQCIDWVGQDSISNMWRHNFLLDKAQLSLQDVEDLMDRGPKTAFANADKKLMYDEAYRKYLINHEDKYNVPHDEMLETTLDGPYWK